MAVLAALLFGEKLTSASYAGLGLGVLGLSLLEVPVDILTTLPQQALGESIIDTNHGLPVQLILV